MKLNYWKFFAFLFVVSMAVVCRAVPENFDDDWEFKLWNVPPFYIAKGGLDHRKSVWSISTIHDDTNGWRKLSVPHDWMVEQPYAYKGSREGRRAVGMSYAKNNFGYYRKHFEVPAAAKDKRVFLRFDGVYRDARFWVNGCYLGRNESGYIGRTFEVTDFLRYGEKDNSVIVYADATLDEGWWYDGAGIYRHVWIDYRDADGLVPDSAYVRLKELTDGVAIMQADWRTFKGGAQTKTFRIENPRLWSPDDPYLYETELAGEKITYGIRTVVFDPNRGLLVNGKRVQVQGVCCHQDHAGVGVAIPDALYDYKIRRLKSFGVNAYRSSHNPPSPALLDACDRHGILFLDETRHFCSGDENLDQFRRLILRDRNHPCVIAWSLGNEEMNLQDTDIGRRIGETMRRVQRELDPSRVCTYGANNGANHVGVNLVTDVRGVNYARIANKRNPKAMDAYHRAHPNVPVWGSEEASSLSTRNCETNDLVRDNVLCDADTRINARYDWSMTAEEWTTFVASRPWYAGAFAWTGFDYRGESNWPAGSCNFGILDLCGFEKNTTSYYRARWTDKDVLHVYPHANLARTNFWVNTNCDEVELVVNDVSAGRQKRPDGVYRLSFPVDFKSGTVEVHGTRRGRSVCTEIATTRSFSRMTCEADRKSLVADGRDVTVVDVVARDDDGREIPDFCGEVVFACTGPGRIIGVGNGNPLSHEDDVCVDGNWKRRFFNGRCQVIVQSVRATGALTLRATCGNTVAETMVAISK